jgi:hypothetical protein
MRKDIMLNGASPPKFNQGSSASKQKIIANKIIHYPLKKYPLFLPNDNRTNKGSERSHNGFEEISLT